MEVRLEAFLRCHDVSPRPCTCLHDETAGGGIRPVVGVLQAQQDVLLVLHLGTHHGLHLLSIGHRFQCDAILLDASYWYDWLWLWLCD